MADIGKVRGEDDWDKEGGSSPVPPSPESPPPGLTPSMSPAKKGRRGSVEILEHFQNKNRNAMDRLEADSMAEIRGMTAQSNMTSSVPKTRHGRRRSVAEVFGGS